MPEPMVTIPLADYDRLLELVEFDDMLVICEVCAVERQRALAEL
jgi:hypothetical protein